MLSNIRDVLVTILVAVIAFVAIIIFFISTLDKQPFDYPTFVVAQTEFKTCASDYEKRNASYQSYNNKDIITMSKAQLVTMRQELELETSCDTEYVTSNKDQYSIYAEDVYNYIGTQGYVEDYGLLDTIYTAPANYYAYTNSPQDYLMFAMNSNQTVLIAYVVTPTETGTEVTQLWTQEQGKDLATVQTYCQNLLVKYYEKII